jgi:hypothetical protein
MPLRPGTELTNLVQQKWRPGYDLAPYEPMVAVKNFVEGSAERFGNLLHIGKISAKTAVTLGATATGQSLTYATDTEVETQVSPTAIYSAVEFTRHGLTRVLESAALQKAYRDQLAAALAARIDSDGLALASSLSTNVVGGPAVDVTKSLLLSAIQKVVTSAKHYARENTQKYLCVHSVQWDDLMAIPDITSAEVRGDGVSPTVKGWVWNAWNTLVTWSGGVSTSGGVAHNLLHVKPSHVIAYNERPDFLPVQPFELTERVITFAEFGVAEHFDELACDLQTKTT